MSESAVNNRKNIIASLIVVLALEVILCGVQQAALFEPYSIVYAIIAVVFIGVEILFCNYLERFSDGSKGIKLFFLYKGVKAFIVIMPVIIYTFFVKDIDPWIPGRAVSYYFAFLLFETALYVKSQKRYKVSVSDK